MAVTGIGWLANPVAPFAGFWPPGSCLTARPAAAGAAGGGYAGAASAGGEYAGAAGGEYAGAGGPVVVAPRGPPNPCQADAPAGSGGGVGA